MAKASFNKKNLLTSKLDLNLRKKLVKCYIWSIVLCGAENWTLWKVDQKYLESFEMWCWRRMENISWNDHVWNERVLHRVPIVWLSIFLPTGPLQVPLLEFLFTKYYKTQTVVQNLWPRLWTPLILSHDILLHSLHTLKAIHEARVIVFKKRVKWQVS